MKIDMKRHIIISIIALSLSFLAQAQEGSKSLTYPTMMEKNLATALWFNSDNAAGMIITPLAQYSDLNVGYNLQNGEYRLQHEGNRNALGINTSGATSLGKAKVWGEFNYENITQKDTRFNTVLLDVDPDMPFYLSDGVVSPWKSQLYDMSVKAATPVLWNVVAFGASLNYFTKAGAKQVDPRSTSYKHGISVDPSVLFTLGKKNSIGLTFSYLNTFERTVPTNSDSQHDQDAFLLRGLGNFKEAVVGSFGGINTFYYKTNKAGLALQYGFKGKKGGLLVQLKGYMKATDDIMTPSKPQAMGSTFQVGNDIDIQGYINGKNFTNKLEYHSSFRETDGIEYLQEIDKSYEVQQWKTIAKYVRSNYAYFVSGLKYDLYKNNERGYSWMVGLKSEYSNREDVYHLPYSEFNLSNVYNEIYGKKNFAAGKSSILIGLSCGLNSNLDGEYNYSGPCSESIVVNELFATNHEILCADYYKAGISANVTFPVGNTTAMYISAAGQYLRAYNMDISRIFASFSVGFTF